MNDTIRTPTDDDAAARRAAWAHVQTDVAEAYERDLVAVLRSWSQSLVAAAGPGPGERVIDVACGTGITARLAAARVGAHGRIVGVDSSPSMLAVAERAAADVEPEIEWHLADAHELPTPDATFEVALCNQGLQFFADPRAALREMHRVLDAEGRLALAVWRPLEHLPGLRRLVEGLTRHVTPDMAAMRAIASPWDRHELRDLVTDAGFTDVHIRIDHGVLRWPSIDTAASSLLAGQPLARPVAALAPHARRALMRNLETAIEPHLDDDGVVADHSSYLVTARRT